MRRGRISPEGTADRSRRFQPSLRDLRHPASAPNANNLHLREMRCLKVNRSSNVKAFDGSKVLERSFFVCQNRKLSEFDLNKVMKQKFILVAAGLAAVGLLAGCETIPPGVERGPHG